MWDCRFWMRANAVRRTLCGPQHSSPFPPPPIWRPHMRQLPYVVAAVASLLVGSIEPAAAQESNFFTASDGVRLHYLTAGDQGSRVVLIHGYTDSARRMWFSTGIAPALAENHRVVAIDNRNHGESDEPTPNGVGRAEDVIELMDHLEIDRAHIHGYSMGGGITGTLLASHPERFITAGFGGSGIRETDESLAELAASFDQQGPAPEGAAARAFENLRARAASRDDSSSRPGGGLAASNRPTLDLSSIDVPVIAINGEFDSPYAKTMRLWRELEVFENVILPGLNHMTAIMVGGPMPQQYIDSMVGFIDTYDQ
ncbi:MAG: alpha/beta fold hydrolase [Gemmatimonas sp.]|nr:alpha/beta fold hydrolase [Gemmatimonas sp.]